MSDATMEQMSAIKRQQDAQSAALVSQAMRSAPSGGESFARGFGQHFDPAKFGKSMGSGNAAGGIKADAGGLGMNAPPAFAQGLQSGIAAGMDGGQAAMAGNSGLGGMSAPASFGDVWLRPSVIGSFANTVKKLF